MHVKSLIFFVIQMFIVNSAVADVYIFTDQFGVTHITNTPQTDQRFKQVKQDCHTRPGGCKKNRKQRLFSKNYSDAINQAAITHRVNPDLIRAVIHAESAFNHLAVSHKGAQGLMQLMPATAEQLGVVDAFDPDQNIEGGAKYLSYLLDMFNDNLELAVAAYNAGENAVLRYEGIPPYNETQNYVKKVRRLFSLYSQDQSS